MISHFFWNKKAEESGIVHKSSEVPKGKWNVLQNQGEFNLPLAISISFAFSPLGIW
jgi:hypothetical protein